MAERIVQIEKLQHKRNVITDEVFHEFCQRISIKDIRYDYLLYPLFFLCCKDFGYFIIPMYNMSRFSLVDFFPKCFFNVVVSVLFLVKNFVFIFFISQKKQILYFLASMNSVKCVFMKKCRTN